MDPSVLFWFGGFAGLPVGYAIRFVGNIRVRRYVLIAASTLPLWLLPVIALAFGLRIETGEIDGYTILLAFMTVVPSTIWLFTAMLGYGLGRRAGGRS